MSDVKWIKITTNMFEDEKIDFIDSLPESDAILVIWIKLLTLAGRNNSNGFIFLTEKIPYTDEMLAHKFKRPLNVVKLALETLKRLEMIEFEEGYLKITNWDKHQNIEGLNKIREQTRKRVAKHREKQKLLPSNVTGNVTVTQGNAIELDKELDKDIPLKKEPKIFAKEDKEYLLAEYLSKQIAKRLNKPLKEEKDLQRWAADFNKMVRLDNYDIEEIKEVLMFSQKNDFWQTNILSAAKLRKQYLTLLSQMKRDEGKGKPDAGKKTNKFHNFIQNDEYTGDDLEAIARKRFENKIRSIQEGGK